MEWLVTVGEHERLSSVVRGILQLENEGVTFWAKKWLQNWHIHHPASKRKIMMRMLGM